MKKESIPERPNFWVDPEFDGGVLPAITPAIPCKGGDLVPAEKISKAAPVVLPSENLQQLTFSL